MIDPKRFRDALGHFATGVTVLTVSDGNGGLTGLTANAFTSVSLDPPLVLACVDYRSSAYPLFCRAKTFGVHILADDQEAVAMAFARKDRDGLTDIDWRTSRRGTPLLEDGLVILECERTVEHQGGDHAILMGRVLDVWSDITERPPLTFYRGQLKALAPAAAEPRYSAASS